MFKYRVVGQKVRGNGIRDYEVLNLKTGEVTVGRGTYLRELGFDNFINVNGSKYTMGFNILKRDKKPLGVCAIYILT